MTEQHIGFITHPVYEIENGQAVVYLYGRLRSGDSFCVRQPYRPYFFVEEPAVEEVPALSDVDIESTDLSTFDDNPVCKVTLDIPKTVPTLRDSILEANHAVYEADIPFTSRFLIDHGVKGAVRITGDAASAPKERYDVFFDKPTLSHTDWRPGLDDLHVLSVDLETDPDQSTVLSAAIATNGGEETVFLNTDADVNAGIICEGEKSLLQKVRSTILSLDPDIITGWNVIDFDFDLLASKFDDHDVPFDLGREEGTSSVSTRSAYMRDSSMTVRGRMVLDGIHVLRNNFVSLDDYKLNTAANHFLDESKDFSGEAKESDILDAYRDEPERFVAYNRRDASLVLDIFKESNALNVSILRSCLTGMPLDRVSSTIASFDSLYLSELRQAGYVAPITHYGRGDKTTGGHVMESTPGIYDNVAVCDFKSLYPSIMRTFNIDPLTHHKGSDADNPIEAPNGATFSRGEAILPSILDKLTEQKDEATENEAWVTRQAVKILMNSMYGVLASPNCRFFSEAMANAITGFGHTLLKHTREVLEDDDYTVIYGDTDSIFIDLGVSDAVSAREEGRSVATQINKHYDDYIQSEYGVESRIVLEFEKLYEKFFTPPQRGSSGGAKKRYAGLVKEEDEEDIDFVGLEYVRRDWTDAAKQFQKKLLWRVFHDDPIEDFVRTFVEDLRDGSYDAELVYTKGLSKHPSEYNKTTPQHVKAAKKIDEFDQNTVSYYVTVDGPEPLSELHHSIDYDHYIEKQIKPIASSILAVLDKTFYDVMQGTEQVDLTSF